MTTSSNEAKYREGNEKKENFNFQPKPLSDESELTEQTKKDALTRIEKLSELSFCPIRPSNDFTEQAIESAYKRRGIDIKQMPHSSEKIAKGFDDSI